MSSFELIISILDNSESEIIDATIRSRKPIKTS